MYHQAILSVENAHEYIFSNDNLKKILNSAGIITTLFKQSIKICQETLHLLEQNAPNNNSNWYIVLQKHIDTVRFLFPTRQLAQQFLSQISLWQLEYAPNLPLYGGCIECQKFSTDLKTNSAEAKQYIRHKILTQSQAPKIVWPFCSQLKQEKEDKTLEKFLSNSSVHRIALLKIKVNESEKVKDEIQQTLTQVQLHPDSVIPIISEQGELTLILHADLALDFVDHYANIFSANSQKDHKTLSIACGMVLMPPNFSLTRAFLLVQELLENAQQFTNQMTPRPCSLDYIVITNNIETHLETLRQHNYTARDGAFLTAKPFLCGIPRQKATLDVKSYKPNACLADILADARLLHEHFPTSQFRSAIDDCRQGLGVANRTWQKIHENFVREIGGCKSKNLASFERIFQNSFFFQRKTSNQTMQYVTLLGDYLELKHVFAPLN